MAEVVNLRQARKARARAGGRAAADRNAAIFGRTKAEKASEKAQAEKAKRSLDGHRRERQSKFDDPD
jgi:hypothetical protein